MKKQIKSNYSLWAKIRLAWWLFRTKLIDRRARIFRFPIDIRGREYINFGVLYFLDMTFSLTTMSISFLWKI